MAVQIEALHDVLDQQQARPPAGEIESGEHLDLVALDVDRHEIERLRRPRILQHVVERHDGHFDAAGAPHAGDVEIRIERGLDAGEMKRQRLAGVLRFRAGDRVDPGAPLAPQLPGEIGLRLDQHAGPAALSSAKDCDPSCGAFAPTSTKKPVTVSRKKSAFNASSLPAGKTAPLIVMPRR